MQDNTNNIEEVYIYIKKYFSKLPPKYRSLDKALYVSATFLKKNPLTNNIIFEAIIRLIVDNIILADEVDVLYSELKKGVISEALTERLDFHIHELRMKYLEVINPKVNIEIYMGTYTRNGKKLKVM